MQRCCGLRGGKAARPREPAALRVAARVKPGRAEPRVPLRHLGALIHQKSFLNTNYFFNFILSGKFVTFSVGGKAHKESSSRKHNQKAPEDMPDWKCENTCYCTSILG